MGSAFYLLFASRSRDARTAATVARLVVVADWIFTATTIVFQPLSGLYLAHRLGVPLMTPWLYWSLVLFVISGLCWLPVVWLQMKLRDLAQAAADSNQPLPLQYDRHLGTWAALGVPALVSFLTVFYLMTAKPALG